MKEHGEKSAPLPFLCTTSPMWTTLSLNPGYCSENVMLHCLSYGRAMLWETCIKFVTHNS